MDAWTLLNSNFVLLLLGFILTTLAGGLLSYWLQKQSWRRQTSVDLYRKRYEEGSQFLDELAKLIGNRFFQLQRYLWILEEMQDNDMHDDVLQAVAEEVEIEVDKTVAEWNSTFWLNRSKIRLLVGEAQAQQFLDYQDDPRTENPRSIQYRFVKAHEAVRRAKMGEVDTSSAQAEINLLNWACSEFFENLTRVFLKRAASLQLLETPEESTKQDRELRGNAREPGSIR
jgi:hypothetical protein